ncbi:MAG: excinuclease ABC subunit UvrC [Hyphomicrobiales bacterium]|nr:excinuclease ABC subunit UvrC [Hyphomicrobiales bacterium]
MSGEDLPPVASEAEDEEEALASLEPPEDDDAESEPRAESAVGAGASVIRRQLKHAPNAPGVYRMIAANGDVLYVGKARNIRARIAAYARGQAHTNRIARMIAETAAMEFVTTATETEALLLEANLIKQLKPRYNVLLRDDKSFPYILVTRDHVSPQITKHRGARNRLGDYYGPFASVWAVNRTLNALQRAFLLRSCSDSFYDNRTRPCLLYQIKRCAGPCTGEVSHTAYQKLVGEARDFLSGKSRSVRARLGTEMQEASDALEFERAARLRDRIAALSAIQASQDINPQSTEEADVFALARQAGHVCVEAFFFRNFQNWGNRAYFPKADPALSDAEVLGPFLAQFYDDKPTPKLILLSHEVEEQELLREALSARSGVRLEIIVPKRGEKRDLVTHASRNAAEALARRLADTSSQEKLLAAAGAAFGLDKAPRRIEVYDNSHIMGTNAIGALIVAGPQGFMKTHYRTFNIKSEELTPGDDYAMMREVLKRRFVRLVKESPRATSPPAGPDEAFAAAVSAPSMPTPTTEEQSAIDAGDIQPRPFDPPPTQFSKRRLGADDSAIYAGQVTAISTVAPPAPASADPEAFPAWPDLVLIDGGRGQLQAALATLAEVGVADVPVVAIAKGPDRNAGRETFHVPGREPFRLEPRDPALYFMQRLRDEAHRFAIGTHRAKRSRELVTSPLDEIGGVGPRRKRALLLHFGTVKAIERASLDDLTHAPGVNAATAKAVYSFFHPNA